MASSPPRDGISIAKKRMAKKANAMSEISVGLVVRDERGEETPSVVTVRLHPKPYMPTAWQELYTSPRPATAVGLEFPYGVTEAEFEISTGAPYAETVRVRVRTGVSHKISHGCLRFPHTAEIPLLVDQRVAIRVSTP